MAYDFSNLSPPDFEDLVCDLLGVHLNLRFELFATGPDGGIDGRHLSAEDNIIVQAKQYLRSPFPKLKSAMAGSRSAIDGLGPHRYILATACPLTPANKKVLATIIGPSLKRESDIFGPHDLNFLLRKYPEVAKSHIKLWLSGSAMLEQIIHAAANTVNQITKVEILDKVRVYATNPSFNAARTTLDKHHVVIISGPPGVGKTTLAEMLCYAYMADSWELTAIRSLDDGFSRINDKKKQIFIFDDFLGMVALDRQALARKDSDLSRFISRIRKSPNARFVLTTRAYILEEATRVSESLANAKLDVAKYVLNVGVYTRLIKSRILYNHLLVAGTPPSHIVALIQSKSLPTIIDHKNYSPRIIEWMTDGTRIIDIPADQYPAQFKLALDQPGRLWDIAFRTHIARMCQHLLICLFFCPQFGVALPRLRHVFERLHPLLCNRFGVPFSTTDFEDSVQVLEGGFVEIRGSTVTFVNPSLRDYLSIYLADVAILVECASNVVDTEWAAAIWDYGYFAVPTDTARQQLSLAFEVVAEQFPSLPAWQIVQTKWGPTRAIDGISNIRRIELLLEWGSYGNQSRYFELAAIVASKPIDGFDPSRDGPGLVEVLGKLLDEDDFYYTAFPEKSAIAAVLESSILSLLSYSMTLEELDNISSEVANHEERLPASIVTAFCDAVQTEASNIATIVSEIESQSTLEDQLATFERLASRAQISPSLMKDVETVVEERIKTLASEELPSEPTIASPTPFKATQPFTDEALESLFTSLIE
jgi:energy-coupling factor transporter ATP-binding protein EcfA2